MAAILDASDALTRMTQLMENAPPPRLSKDTPELKRPTREWLDSMYGANKKKEESSDDEWEVAEGMDMEDAVDGAAPPVGSGAAASSQRSPPDPSSLKYRNESKVKIKVKIRMKVLRKMKCQESKI